MDLMVGSSSLNSLVFSVQLGKQLPDEILKQVDLIRGRTSDCIDCVCKLDFALWFRKRT